MTTIYQPGFTFKTTIDGRTCTFVVRYRARLHNPDSTNQRWGYRHRTSKNGPVAIIERTRMTRKTPMIEKAALKIAQHGEDFYIKA
jgi:hypothetical protein